MWPRSFLLGPLWPSSVNHHAVVPATVTRMPVRGRVSTAPAQVLSTTKPRPTHTSSVKKLGGHSVSAVRTRRETVTTAARVRALTGPGQTLCKPPVRRPSVGELSCEPFFAYRPILKSGSSTHEVFAEQLCSALRGSKNGTLRHWRPSQQWLSGARPFNAGGWDSVNLSQPSEPTAPLDARQCFAVVRDPVSRFYSACVAIARSRACRVRPLQSLYLH